MHEIQKKILELSRKKNMESMSLRDVALAIGEDDRFPEKMRHHLLQLQKKGFLRYNRGGGSRVIQPGSVSDSGVIAIPIYGAANAGPASIVARQNLQGYLMVSKKLLSRSKKDIFAIRISGDSMNAADVEGKTIDDGDYVLVDPAYRAPAEGDYVLSVIGDMANIKKIHLDKINDQVVLLSESTKDYAPIFIHQEDEYIINGKVVQVIKTPKL
ncbi:MAG: hypothetical protein HY420_01605 [Candidatus Kerfeldbacteria bacterium]|nr:hypothetical protein [Candidatus Kerfeldbacteria bacterium]